jgi:hypothetical protein
VRAGAAEQNSGAAVCFAEVWRVSVATVDPAAAGQLATGTSALFEAAVPVVVAAALGVTIVRMRGADNTDEPEADS